MERLYCAHFTSEFLRDYGEYKERKNSQLPWQVYLPHPAIKDTIRYTLRYLLKTVPPRVSTIPSAVSRKFYLLACTISLWNYNTRLWGDGVLFRSQPHYGGARTLNMQLFFLRTGLQSTPIRHENGVLRKRSSNGGIWKCHFWICVDIKRRHHDSHAISLTEFPSNTNPKSPVIVGFEIPQA